MSRVYTASKLHHAAFWRELALKFPQIHFTARWIYYIEFLPEGNPANALHAKNYWLDDQYDVQRSDFVLAYCAPGDTLRGALVEIGIGIAMEKEIILVGKESQPSFGTWQFHPLVRRFDTMEEALDLFVPFGPII